MNRCIGDLDLSKPSGRIDVFTAVHALTLPKMSLLATGGLYSSSPHEFKHSCQCPTYEADYVVNQKI